MVRTRTLAQELAASGHVRLNGERVDAASRLVRIGDVLTIALEGRVRVLKVKAFAERRGGAPEAALLYDDLSPQPAPPPPGPWPIAAREPGEGRPTKRDRRLIDRARGGD